MNARWVPLTSLTAAGLLVAACGSSEQVDVTVTLSLPAKAELSPLSPGVRLSAIRYSVAGIERGDQVYAERPANELTHTFEGYPSNRTAVVSAEGLDAHGTVVAFARTRIEVEGDDLALDLPFRRPLAYVLHQPTCGGGCRAGQACVNPGDGFTCMTEDNTCGGCSAQAPCVAGPQGPACFPRFDSGRLSSAGRSIYAIDLTTRTLVEKVTIPGTDPRGVGISPYGGEGVLVTYVDGTKGFAALLSSSDHQFAWTLQLPAPQEITIGRPGYAKAVSAGGGSLTVIDLTTPNQPALGRTLAFGGRIQEALVAGGGKRAVFATSAGLALLDLALADAPLVDPGQVDGSAGVALAADDRLVYVNSTRSRQLFALDVLQVSLSSYCSEAIRLANGTCPEDRGFAGPAGSSIYSERTQQVLALEAGEGADRVFTFDLVRGAGDPLANALPTLAGPVDLALGPGGHRAVVLATGTSSATAGMTVIDLASTSVEASSSLYPPDPVEVAGNGPARFQPTKLAILYGQ